MYSRVLAIPTHTVFYTDFLEILIDFRFFINYFILYILDTPPSSKKPVAYSGWGQRTQVFQRHVKIKGQQNRHH
jgi:hypothetical protein